MYQSISESEIHLSTFLFFIFLIYFVVDQEKAPEEELPAQKKVNEHTKKKRTTPGTCRGVAAQKKE
jgi:hypothetical protein